MQKALRKTWPIILIALLSVALRVYKLEELFYFTYDESIPAFVGRRLILWHHIPFIGGVTPFGFHLGPYFYWCYALLLAIGKFDPLIWGYTGAFLSTLTTLLIFKVGRSIDSKRLGLTAAIIWAFSALANIYDRHLWALYWGPITSLLVIFSLVKIVGGNYKFIYLLALTIGLSVHADPSNIVFLVVAIVVWIIRKPPLNRHTVFSILIIFSFFLPLIFFDLRHNFANSKPVLEFINKGQNKPGLSTTKLLNNALIFPQTATRLVYKFGYNEVSKDYSYCQTYIKEKHNSVPPAVLAAIATILLLFTVWYTRSNSNWQILGIITLVYFLGIQIYGTIFKADIFEHYLTGLFAVFALIFAKTLSLLPKKLWLFLLAVFILFNLVKITQAENLMGLKIKKEAINYVYKNAPNQNFSIDSLSSCWRLNGYRYLFAAYGKEPVKSYVDPNLGYLYETTPIAEKHPTNVFVFVVHDYQQETDDFYKRYALLKSHEKQSQLFGIIEVIHVDNSSAWFDRAN